MAGKINRIAIPSIIAGLSEPIVSLTDNFFISTISDAAVTAVGVSASFFMLLVWVLGSLRGAVSAEIAHFLGLDDKKGIQEVSFQSLFFVAVIGLLISLLVVSFTEPILKIYELEGIVLQKAEAYLSIRLIGLPFVFSTVVLSAIFRGVHETRFIMYAVFSGAIINVVLDYLLIGGNNYFPAMGVEGAALASLISQAIVFSILFFQFIVKVGFKPSFHFYKGADIARHSLNLMVRAASMNLIFFLLNRWAVSIGVEFAAVHVVYINIWLFTAYFIDGYSDAAMVMGGSLKAQSKMNEVLQLLKKVITINVVLGLLLSLGIGLLSSLLAFKLLHSEEAYAVFQDNLYLLLIAVPLGGVCFSIDGVLIGTKHSIFLRNYMVCSVLSVLLAYFLLKEINLTHTLMPIWGSVIVWLLYRALTPFLFLSRLLKD